MFIDIIIYLIFISSLLLVLAVYENRKTNDQLIKLDYLNSKVDKIVTEGDIINLPTALQSYLKFAGVVGKPVINKVVIVQNGKYCKYGKTKMHKYSAFEYLYLNINSFLWSANIKIIPFLNLRVIEKLKGGYGQKIILLFSSIFLEKSKISYEATQETIVRYLNNLVWAPTAFLSKDIKWVQLADDLLKCEIIYENYKVPAYIKIDSQGKIISFTAKRFMESDKVYKSEIWSNEFSSYKEFNGFMVPTESSSVWHLKEGDFEYIKYKVKDAIYK